MRKFYFFKSSSKNDVISGLSVFTNSPIKAFNYAAKQFAKLGCKGVPQVLAV